MLRESPTGQDNDLCSLTDHPLTGDVVHFTLVFLTLTLIHIVVAEQKQQLQEAQRQLQALEANLEDLQKKREVDNRALEV